MLVFKTGELGFDSHGLKDTKKGFACALGTAARASRCSDSHVDMAVSSLEGHVNTVSSCQIVPRCLFMKVIK